MKVNELTANKLLRPATVFICIACVWLISLVAYAPVFNVYKSTPHLWLTGSTIKFTKHWMQSGAASNMFALMELPRSIETPDLASQGVYSSYPPGAVLPIWGISKIFSISPELPLVRFWNLLIQLGVSLCIAGFVWNSLRAFGRQSAFPGALTGGLYYLLSVIPARYHFSAYFADQAVLLPVALLLYYESSARKKKWLPLMVVMCLWGALTDPLMYFVGGTLILLRWAQGWRKKALGAAITQSAYMAVPLLLGLLLFVGQIICLDQTEALVSTFFRRTAGKPEGGIELSIISIIKHFRRDYLTFIVIIILIVTICWDARNHFTTLNKILCINIIIIYFISIFAHSVIFFNHSCVHQFSIMKYSILFAAVFGINFGLLYLIHNKVIYFTYITSISLLFFLFCKHIAIIYKTNEIKDIYLAQVIKSHNSFSNIFLSPVYSIKQNPPMLMSIADKEVHFTPNSRKIDQRLLVLDPSTYKIHYIVPEDFFAEQEMEDLKNEFPDLKIVIHAAGVPVLTELVLTPNVNIKTFVEYVDALKAEK